MADPSRAKRRYSQPTFRQPGNIDFRSEFSPEIIALADRGVDIRNTTLAMMTEDAGLAEDSWAEASLEAGQFIWHGRKADVTSPIQGLGTRMASSSSWMWAWANPSFPPPMRSAALELLDFGRTHSVRPLTARTLHCDDEQKWVLGNIAMGLGLGTFVYLATSPRIETHLLLTNPRIRRRAAS